MKTYDVRIGGQFVGVQATSAKAAIAAAIRDFPDAEFEKLADKVESRRITCSVVEVPE